MGEQRGWNWDVTGFEPRKPVEQRDDYRKAVATSMSGRRYSMSISSRSDLSKFAANSKLTRLKDRVKLVREEYLTLRQEAMDLQEYSSANLDQVMQYLGVLADKTRKLEQSAFEIEARISPLISEKKRLFNDLLTAKGNVKVFCRTRTLLEDEGPSIVEFPDDFTVQINSGDETQPKKDFVFDKVYGPHVGQADIFADIQPFVQSAFDGYNVSVFAYGQSRAGKTYTMEGSSHDQGLYARSFEELSVLSNSDMASTSQYSFSVSVIDIHNEKIKDLLPKNGDLGNVHIWSQNTDEYFTNESIIDELNSDVEVVQQIEVESPIEFSNVLKSASKNRGSDPIKFKASHLIVMIHVYYKNLLTGENKHSKLSFVDLAGSDCVSTGKEPAEHSTELLHVLKSLSVLGEVLASTISKKDNIPYGNSKLTKILADSIGGSSKTVMIVNICPSMSSMSETLSSLNFSSRVRDVTLRLGNQDTILKWKDDAEKTVLADKFKIEKDQNLQLRNQIAHLLQVEQEQKLQIEQKDSTIQMLQAKLQSMESQFNEALSSKNTRSTNSTGLQTGEQSSNKSAGHEMDSSAVTKRLEDELKKRDALIEKLHEENEKLFDRLTEKASSAASSKVSTPPGALLTQSPDIGRTDNANAKGHDVSSPNITVSARALVVSGIDKGKTTPAGEYLTAALNDFDPEKYDSLAAISDGANKLLMLVLAAVIKAGASREHDILAEIRDAVFAFIHKLEPKRVMDTMLVSRVRILYIRSLLARSPDLQSIKVLPVERFLEKPAATGTGRSRNSSRGSSPGRSPGHHDSSVNSGARNMLIEEYIQGFTVNIKPDKRSKLSSVVLKIRGIDEDAWRQHLTGGKLREITEEAKSYAVGRKTLAALFVHTPAGELQRQIRNWVAENFDFLTVADDSVTGATGQIDLLSTAIMDGWMAGLGSAQPPNTDALGQLLSEYARRMYTSQLQHLKDIAGTLATEMAEDCAQVSKLRSALESVDHKRRKILQQMKSDELLFSLEVGAAPIGNPSTAAEDARLASLISLDDILKQTQAIIKQTSVSVLSKSKKRSLLDCLDELSERMPSLLDVDHPCAQRHIADARQAVELTSEEDKHVDPLHASKLLGDMSAETDVSQWNVLQFNTGSTTPFIIKCGANSNSELVIKADASVQEPKGGEIVRVVPKPTTLENMSLDEIKETFSQLPEALSLLALARTADGTRARYSRLYRTLAMKVPALKELVGELEKAKS